MTRVDIEKHLKGIVNDRFIELWWDLKIPGLGKQTPNEVYSIDPARLLEYVKSYSDPSFT